MEGEIFRTRPDRPWSPPSLLYNGYGSFPGLKRPRRGVDHPPHLAPRLKKKYRCTSTLSLALRGLSQSEIYLTFTMYSGNISYLRRTLFYALIVLFMVISLVVSYIRATEFMCILLDVVNA